MNLLENRLGRKFLLTTAILCALFVLMISDKIPPADFRFLVMFVFGSYIGGNLGEKAITKGSK